MEETFSDAAVRKATGHGWRHWERILDAFPQDIDHTERAKRLSARVPDLAGWWVQAVTVGYERRRGLRARGQTHTGDFQASAQRTLPLDPDAAWARLMAVDWLPGARWEEGARFPDPVQGAVVVRAVRPAQLLRFWRETPGGRRIVEVSLVPQGEKTAIRFTESKLADDAEWEQSRGRWKEALGRLS